MSLAENSFEEEGYSPAQKPPSSLCDELVNEQFKWSNSFHKSQASFGDQSIQNDYIQPNSNNRLEVEPQLNVNNESNPNSIDVEPFQEEQEDPAKTISVIGDSILSKQSIQVSSRLSQYSSQVDNESYGAFLNMLQTSYSPLVKGFEVLFQNVSNLFHERNKQIKGTYLQFLKIKSQQKRSFCQMGLGKTVNNKNSMMYIDCQGLAEEIRKKVEDEREEQKNYAENLEYIYKKAKKQFMEIEGHVEERERRIRQTLKKLTEIARDMNDIMIPRNRKMRKYQIKEELLTTSYVRNKYLIGKEKDYLVLMKQFLTLVTTFVSYSCLEVEPKNCLIVKESLTLYFEATSGNNQKLKDLLGSKVDALEKTNCYLKIFKEVSKLLQLCIPSSLDLHQSLGVNDKDRLHAIIEALIRQSQSVVYMPVIQIEGKDYAYHSKNKATVFWKRIDYTQKLKQQQIQQFEAQVVITHEGYLILELIETASSQEKMAILKLKNIKLGVKNNEVIITDKGTGVMGYLLSSNNVLGSLYFQTLKTYPENQSDEMEAALIKQFVDRVKAVMEVHRESIRK